MTIDIPINLRIPPSNKNRAFYHIQLIENSWAVQEMTGFVPAAELVAWRVPKSATYRLLRLEERSLCVEGKESKTGSSAESVGSKRGLEPVTL